ALASHARDQWFESTSAHHVPQGYSIAILIETTSPRNISTLVSLRALWLVIRMGSLNPSHTLCAT
ncbi:MAG: hypothetical protein AABY38_02725, partial [Planctomycetota bacterium]